MAPKRQSKNVPPPSHTAEPESDSTGSDDDLQTDQESDSDDDSGSNSDQSQKPISPEPKKPRQESDPDDDSDSSSDKTQKPLSPKPKKPVSKPESKPVSKSVSKPTEVKANGKRPAETDHIDKAKKSNKKSKGGENVEKGSENVVKVGAKSVENVGLKSVDKGKAKVSNGEEKGSKGVDKVGLKSVDKGKGKVNGDEEGGEKVGLFARLFSEEDEIELLERMLEFKENKGGDSSFDIVAFHDFVEGFLSCTVTKSQVSDKIRRLKKRYVNYLSKGKDGEDLLISKPREFKLFEISKKIWGTEGLGSKVNADTKVKTSRGLVGKEREIKDEVMEHTDDWWSQYPLLCASLEAEAARNFTGPLAPKNYVNKVVSRMNKDKARELEQEWEDVSVMEHQAYAKRRKVISKQAKAGMEVYQH